MEFLFGSCSAEVRLVFDWCSTILRWRMNWVLGKGNRVEGEIRITCCFLLPAVVVWPAKRRFVSI